MKFTVIIPARYASTRLPGKPLIKINGRSMIEWVYRQAEQSLATDVVVATDDERIVAEVEGFNGKVCMTRRDHESGTDRLEEAARFLNLSDEDIVVNVQGDEPLIPPELINQVAGNLHESQFASASTLCEAITDESQLFDENAVKVVFADNKKALYFSRAPIAWQRGNFNLANKTVSAPQTEGPLAYRHIGIYGYRVRLLKAFTHWPMAELEKREKLEQLRILTNGHDIHVDVSSVPVPPGVDTEEDYIAIQKRFN